MNKTTIKDYFNNVQHPIGNTPTFAPFNFDTFMIELEQFVKITYGSLCLRPSVLDDVDNWSELRNLIGMMCNNVYVTNRYKYETLWDSMNFEYNPIENYNMVEHESIDGSSTTDTTNVMGSQTNTHSTSESNTFGAIEKTNNGTDTKTNVYGAKTTTTSETNNVVNEFGETEENAEHRTTETLGSRTDNKNDTTTENIGEFKTSTSANRGGNSSGSVTEQVSAYNESDWSNATKRVSSDERHEEDTGSSTEEAHTNTTTVTGSITLGGQSNSNVVIDTVSNAEHTDEVTETKMGSVSESSRTDSENVAMSQTEVVGSHTDNVSGSGSDVIGGREDSSNVDSANSSERELTRKGNIGVTTTQQMLEQERQIALFNIYSVIATDIISVIALRIY